MAGNFIFNARDLILFYLTVNSIDVTNKIKTVENNPKNSANSTTISQLIEKFIANLFSAELNDLKLFVVAIVPAANIPIETPDKSEIKTKIIARNILSSPTPELELNSV